MNETSPNENETRRGLLIAIEGIDGSGKGTQAKLLVDRLNASGTSSTLFSFPQYEQTRFGRLIGEYLNGSFGALNAVHPLLASLLYSGDRFETRPRLRAALDTHAVVVCDRYVASNMAHQGAKTGEAERSTLLKHIAEIEFDIYGLPRPDRTIWLDLPVAESVRLIAKKSARSYTDKAADLHEADHPYLRSVYEVYRDLANDPEWSRIECAPLDAAETPHLRSLSDIADEVFATVQGVISRVAG